MLIDKIFLTVLNMSFAGAIVIAMLCLVRPARRKEPKIIIYCLWAFAAFRLLFPFSIKSALSIMPMRSQPIPLDIATQAAPRINSGVSFINETISSSLPRAAAGDSMNPLQLYVRVGAVIWLIGAAALLVYAFVSYAALKRKLNGAKQTEENIYEAENIRSPFLIGIFAPRIYLPTGLSEKERAYVILHEKIHIRRKDYIIKLFAYFILCLHWFNPMVWVAFALMNTDMEMSCDERVIKEMGEEVKKEYSLSLVSLGEGCRRLRPSPIAFGEGDLKERIKNILNFKSRSRALTILTAVIAFVVGTVFILDREDIATEEDPVPELVITEAESGESRTALRFGYSYDNGTMAVTADSMIPWQGEYTAANTFTLGGNGQNELRLSIEKPLSASYRIYKPDGTVYDSGDREMLDSLGSRLLWEDVGTRLIWTEDESGIYMLAPFESGEYIYELNLSWEKYETKANYGFKVIMTEAGAETPKQTPPRSASDALYEGYYNIVQKLYGIDTGLNDAIKYVAVELSEVPVGQRTALELLFTNWTKTLGLTFLPSDWDALLDSGLITTTPIEDAGFKEGVLFTFENVVFEGNVLTVQATKYRGPLGAVSATFTATYEDGIWTVGEPEGMLMA